MCAKEVPDLKQPSAHTPGPECPCPLSLFSYMDPPLLKQKNKVT